MAALPVRHLDVRSRIRLGVATGWLGFLGQYSRLPANDPGPRNSTCRSDGRYEDRVCRKGSDKLPNHGLPLHSKCRFGWDGNSSRIAQQPEPLEPSGSEDGICPGASGAAVWRKFAAWSVLIRRWVTQFHARAGAIHGSRFRAARQSFVPWWCLASLTSILSLRE